MYKTKCLLKQRLMNTEKKNKTGKTEGKTWDEGNTEAFTSPSQMATFETRPIRVPNECLLAKLGKRRGKQVLQHSSSTKTRRLRQNEIKLLCLLYIAQDDT